MGPAERPGVVIDAHFSPAIGHSVAMAMLDVAFAHSGVDRYAIRGAPVRTISPPFVNNLSMYVNPQRDSFNTRDAVRFPGSARSAPTP